MTPGGKPSATDRSAASSRSAAARSRSSGRELPLATYTAVADRDLLGEAAVGRMLAGLSSRHYGAGLEPIGSEVATRGTSHSSVSRRFVAGTAAKLAQLRSRDLSGMHLLARFIDGIEIGGQTIVVALGVDAAGHKPVLGLWEGSTENAAVCGSLLGNLIGPGLATDRALLFITDGGKGIAKAIADTFGALALHQRCRLHKRRTVMGQLPEGLRPLVGQQLDAAWAKEDPEGAERALRSLASSLEENHPGAAASLREGLEETLTISRLSLSPALVKTFKSTNPIESLNDGMPRRTGRRCRLMSAACWSMSSLARAG